MLFCRLKVAYAIGCVRTNLTGMRVMSTHRGPAARNALPRKREQRRDWRDNSATKYAWYVGEVICDRLQQVVRKGITLKDAVEAALKHSGCRNCEVKIIKGEVHAFIGYLKDSLHGHVIVPIRSKVMRYCRGYAMPHGPRNHLQFASHP